jgi:predicted  nucleic acid-binding Zn-ribbon protein
MGDESGDGSPSFAVYENVSCLECGTVYTKPSRGGTARSNPGCPECGYVGWVAVSARSEQAQPRRSDEDPPLRRSAQSR